MLRVGILGSSENTKTNEVNVHGFCTVTFFNWLKVGLRICLWDLWDEKIMREKNLIVYKSLNLEM